MSSGALLSHFFGPAVVLVTTWLMPSLAAPTLPFAVRVPASHANDPVIVAQRRFYRWWVGLAGGVLVLVGLTPDLAAGSPLTGVASALAVLAVSLGAFFRAHAAITAAKEREDWYAGLRQAVTTDTSLRTSPERFPWPWAAPSLLVVAFTAVAGVIRYPSMPGRLAMHYNGADTVDRYAAKSVSSAFLPLFVEAGITALMLVLTWLVFRSRADLDPARPAASALQYRRFQVRTATSLLVLTACVDLTILAAGWQIWDGDRTISPALTLTPLFVGIAWLIGVAITTGQNGSRLRVEGQPAPDTGVVHRDDDGQWRGGGLIYVNRHDPALFVPKRFGVGWTMNLGNPHVVVLVVAIVGFVLAIELLAR